MPPAGFEPAMEATKWPQVHASDTTTTGINYYKFYTLMCLFVSLSAPYISTANRLPLLYFIFFFIIFNLCEFLLPHVMLLKCTHINHRRISSVPPFIFMYSFWNKQKFRAP